MIRSRKFTRKDFRWEYCYFRDNILRRFGEQNPSVLEKCEDEWIPIINILASLPITVMHRDFQSQNVYLRNNEILILDFQGIRIGLPHYDLASLLEDPYVDLPSPLKETLFNYYLENIPRECFVEDRSTRPFSKMYRWAAISRLMQACGAFSFLGYTKGKTSFLQYIPVGMRRLLRLLEQKNDLETLKECVTSTLSNIVN